MPRVPAHREGLAGSSPRRAARHHLPRGAGPDAKLRPSIELDGVAASSSFDQGGSIDSDPVARRDAVERDTAAKLRETIAKMGGEQIMDPRAFVSTDEQRLVTAGLFASCAALVLRGVCGVQLGEEAGSPLAWAELLGSVAAAYWLSDVGTGIFHWSVDNYGDKNTPVMGGIIDAFQGHHKYPWTITDLGSSRTTSTPPARPRCASPCLCC